MSIIKSTKSGTYGMRVLPKIFYDNADYYFGTTYKDGDWCCSIHHKKDRCLMAAATFDLSQRAAD